MPEGPRLELWQLSFRTYYEAYFQELLAEKLINRWQRFDEPSRALVALTASGSAVSGWALWAQPGFRAAWVILAGGSAVLATLHATLNVPGRLKDQADFRRQFSGLRLDLETFRDHMRLEPNFAMDQFTAKFDELRGRYSNAYQLLKNDFFLTQGLETECQDILDQRLADEVQ
jgi:hypothetical protein